MEAAPIHCPDGQESAVPASTQVFMPLDFSRPARQWSVLLAQGAVDNRAAKLANGASSPTVIIRLGCAWCPHAEHVKLAPFSGKPGLSMQSRKSEMDHSRDLRDADLCPVAQCVGNRSPTRLARHSASWWRRRLSSGRKDGVGLGPHRNLAPSCHQRRTSTRRNLRRRTGRGGHPATRPCAGSQDACAGAAGSLGRGRWRRFVLRISGRCRGRCRRKRSRDGRRAGRHRSGRRDPMCRSGGPEARTGFGIRLRRSLGSVQVNVQDCPGNAGFGRAPRLPAEQPDRGRLPHRVSA